MARLKQEWIVVGKDPLRLSFKFDVNVNSSGEFTTNLKPDDVEKLSELGVETRFNSRGRQGHFSADTLQELLIKVRTTMEEAVSKIEIDRQTVIRYAINTTANYWLTRNNEILPNGSWDKSARKPSEYSGWQSGTEDINSARNRPVGIKMYVDVAEKVTYEYKSGQQKIEYEKVEANSPDSDKFYLAWLNSLHCLSKPDNATIQEIPYTEESAKFFVELYKGLCRLAKMVSDFVEPEKMIELIQSGKILTM